VVALNQPRIGLALSGGGFRATAFGLGCLRTLHDHDLLQQVEVVAGVSGGGLLSALYAYGPTSFGDFDASVVELLRRGLQLEILRRSVRPDRVATSVLRNLRSLRRGSGEEGPILRSAARSEALMTALDAHAFKGKRMDDGTHDGLTVVISATDLRTSNAVRFGSIRSSCSAYGVIAEPVGVAEAVAASAAYPLLLPPVERHYTFEREPGVDPMRRVVLLSDGGIYDNLATSVLEPRRSPAHTAQVFDLDYVIAADAGRGPLRLTSRRRAPFRLKRSFDIAYRRAQDGARGRMYQALDAGQLKGFVHAYLGMRDDRMPVPLVRLTPVDDVRSYPTDFRAMKDVDLDLLSSRGEQLTAALLRHFCPEL